MKRKLLSILVLLCISASSAWAEWGGGTYTATADEEINSTINVNADATLTINAGVTMTINEGIVVAEGKTLTVTGGGTLKVNGVNGGNYGDGGDAIIGNVVIKDANIEATGGDGDEAANGESGYDGDGGYDGGQGSKGGNAFANGIVTIYSGNVIATGGQGGQGGYGGDGSENEDSGEYGDGGNGGDGGDGGFAFNGTVIIYGGSVDAHGGEGGQGGDGGYGGDGGNDGYGGNGGEGGAAFSGTFTFYGGSVDAYGGQGGDGGEGGVGGVLGYAFSGDIVTFETTNYVMSCYNYNYSYDSYIKNSKTTVSGNARVEISAEDAVYILITANSADGAYWTTFYSESNNFKADANTQVFKVELSGTQLTMHEVEDRIVNSYMPVVLKSTSSNIVMTVSTSSVGDGNPNDLNGWAGPGNLAADGNMYVLNNGSQGVGFYKLKDGKSLSPGKAYLYYSGSLARDFFGFDETTSLREISNEKLEISNYYTLDGRKIQGKPTTKGLYIVNGKKVVIK